MSTFGILNRYKIRGNFKLDKMRSIWQCFDQDLVNLNINSIYNLKTIHCYRPYIKYLRCMDLRTLYM